MTRAIAQFPHCDTRVLHAPGECDYCDLHPDWQEFRATWNVNFTGQHNPNKTICPAERARPLSTINHWGGNQAQPLISEQKLGRWAWFPWLKD